MYHFWIETPSFQHQLSPTQWPKGTRPSTATNTFTRPNPWTPSMELRRLRTDPRLLARYDERPPHRCHHQSQFTFFSHLITVRLEDFKIKKNHNHPLLQVEIEVPQTCNFIVRTTGCSLSQVVNMDAAGNPVFAPAPTTDNFAAEMERWGHSSAKSQMSQACRIEINPWKPPERLSKKLHKSIYYCH